MLLSDSDLGSVSKGAGMQPASDTQFIHFCIFLCRYQSACAAILWWTTSFGKERRVCEPLSGACGSQGIGAGAPQRTQEFLVRPASSITWKVHFQ